MDNCSPLRRSKKIRNTTSGQIGPALRLVPSDQPAARDGAKIERAYQRLRQDIMSGAYSPNERLVEAPLTQLLGVSRNSLRTVLVRLQQEGLVVLEPNRGGRVRAISLEEAHDILHVREVLEGLIAALAAVRATPPQRTRLRTIIAEMERAVADDDLTRYSALNGQFHTRVLEAAESPQAAALLDSLHFPLVKLQFHPALVRGRRADSLEEHRELLRAIEARNADAAERAARLHIQRIRGALKQQ